MIFGMLVPLPNFLLSLRCTFRTIYVDVTPSKLLRPAHRMPHTVGKNLEHPAAIAKDTLRETENTHD